MDDAVRKLAADSGILRHVLGHREPEGYALLDLSFDHGSLRLTTDADTDEIIVKADRGDSSDAELAEIVDDAALSSLRGKVVELAWSMSNHRGYADAFQVRCIDPETRHESCCQFEVAAAAIRVNRVG